MKAILVLAALAFGSAALAPNPAPDTTPQGVTQQGTIPSGVATALFGQMNRQSLSVGSCGEPDLIFIHAKVLHSKTPRRATSLKSFRAAFFNGPGTSKIAHSMAFQKQGVTMPGGIERDYGELNRVVFFAFQ